MHRKNIHQAPACEGLLIRTTGVLLGVSVPVPFPCQKHTHVSSLCHFLPFVPGALHKDMNNRVCFQMKHNENLCNRKPFQMLNHVCGTGGGEGEGKSSVWSTIREKETRTSFLGRVEWVGFCVANVSGGVVGDLAGFVAATYMRGIPFVQVLFVVLCKVNCFFLCACDLTGLVCDASSSYLQPDVFARDGCVSCNMEIVILFFPQTLFN